MRETLKDAVVNINKIEVEDEQSTWENNPDEREVFNPEFDVRCGHLVIIGPELINKDFKIRDGNLFVSGESVNEALHLKENEIIMEV